VILDHVVHEGLLLRPHVEDPPGEGLWSNGRRRAACGVWRVEEQERGGWGTGWQQRGRQGGEVGGEGVKLSVGQGVSGLSREVRSGCGRPCPLP